MSKIALIVDSVCVEYSNSRTKVEVELNGVDVDDVISEIEHDKILDGLEEEKVIAWLEGKGFEVTDE